MGFSICTVLTALQRIVCNIFNYGLWFEYFDSSGREVRRIRYGEYLSDIYPTTIPSTVSILENSIQYGIDGVIVYGETNKLYATKGNIGPQYKVAAYRYNGCQSLDELQYVANKIYEQRSILSTRYEVVFPGLYFDIHEGDRLHFYDSVIGIPKSDEGYGVKDVQITNKYIKVGLGAPKTTIFDILNDRLSIIDGNILSYDPYEFTLNWKNVMCAASTDTWGATTDFTVTISGETFMGDYLLTPIVGGEQVEGAGYKRIFAAIAHSTSDITITTSDTIITGKDVLNNPDFFPWTIDHAEVIVSYVFDPDETEEDAKVDWTMTWGNDTKDLYTEDNYMITGFSGETYSSFVVSQVVHNWYLNGVESMPLSWPKLTVKCHTGTTSAVLKDLIVKLVIYYDAENTYAPVEVTMPNGQIRMRIKYPTSYNQDEINYTDWITIYDTANKSAYIGKHMI